MAGQIRIDSERCKGCGLCVVVCPKKSIRISEKSNRNGYFPAEFCGSECTGCAMCAIICPEAVIEVSSDDEPASASHRPAKRGEQDEPHQITEAGSKNKILPRQQANELNSRQFFPEGNDTKIG
ncbi:MAG: ferredoxin family protein [Sedimentisphaerales bacterium]|nr:ferredoxin family protein [Sedimentisphaerales bacterium]